MIFRDQLRPEDKSILHNILIQTGFFFDYEIAVAIELIDDRLEKKEKSHYQFLLAQENEDPSSVIAFTSYGFVAGTQSSYDLYWLAVDPTKQNKHMGSTLLKEVEQRIKEAGGKNFYAETSGREKYKPTHQFYLRNNFILEARLKDFYFVGDDKLFFSKVL